MTLMSSRFTPSPISEGTAVITQAAAKSISPRTSSGSRTCGCTGAHCPRRSGAIDPREDVEQAVGGIDARCAAFSSHEICGFRDPRLLEGYQAERRLIIDQENGDQFPSRISGVELDQGTQVAEADVVGAARDLSDGAQRARAGQ